MEWYNAYVAQQHKAEYGGFKKKITIFGSGALPGKILLVRIVENNKIDAYFRVG